MADEGASQLAVPLKRPDRTLASQVRLFVRYYPVGVVALAVLAALVAASALAPAIARFDPLEIDFSAIRVGPSGAHWFGTDDLGRDVFTRVLYGGRVTLVVAVFSVLIGDGLGFIVGIVSAYAGGWYDLIMQRVLEVLLAFPALILALLLLVAIGGGVSTIIIAIAVTRIPDSGRVVRSSVLSIKQEPYVEAARSIGAPWLRVTWRHVAPQTLGLFLVIISINFGFAVFAEAALSFLGVGVPPPTATWGGMLGAIVSHIFNPAWWLVVFPGLAIVITVLAMNLLGDAIRDFADPRSAERRKVK